MECFVSYINEIFQVVWTSTLHVKSTQYLESFLARRVAMNSTILISCLQWCSFSMVLCRVRVAIVVGYHELLDRKPEVGYEKYRPGAEFKSPSQTEYIGLRHNRVSPPSLDSSFS